MEIVDMPITKFQFSYFRSSGNGKLTFGKIPLNEYTTPPIHHILATKVVPLCLFVLNCSWTRLQRCQELFAMDLSETLISNHGVCMEAWADCILAGSNSTVPRNLVHRLHPKSLQFVATIPGSIATDL